MPQATEAAPDGGADDGFTARLMRGDLVPMDCPERQLLNHLTSRWGVLVLIALLPGTTRFSALRRRIGGVSERMLAQTLQQLEGDAIVQRRAYPTVPPHVEYSLTPLGQEAALQMKALADWIEARYPALRDAAGAGGAPAPG